MSFLRKNPRLRRTSRRLASSGRHWFHPLLDLLEARLTPSTLVVTTTADSGPGSLRQAITQSNSDVGMMDTITFSVTGAINLQSALPTLTNSVNIDGPGADSLAIAPVIGVNAGIFTIAGGVTANISGLTLERVDETNLVLAHGGAIINAGTLNLTACAITGNHVTGEINSVTGAGVDAEGGGIYNSGTLVVMDSTISGNFAMGGTSSSPAATPGGEGLGGGIYTDGGSVTLVASTISSNYGLGGGGSGETANPGTGGEGAGGGLYVTGGAQVALYSSVVLDDDAFGGVGGDSTSANEAGNGGNALGGGIFVDSGTLSIVSDTIAYNRAAGGAPGSGGSTGASYGSAEGGGIDNAGGSVTLADTIVADNTSNSGPGRSSSDVQGMFQSNGYNLIQNPSGGTFTGNTGTNLYNVDPLLPPNSDILQVDSVAVDAGDPNYVASGMTATDVRGLPRIANGRVDIGAYEVQANELRLMPGSTIAAASSSVVLAVTAGNGLAVHENGAWTTIGGAGTIATISAVTDVNGNATVFAVTTNYALAEWSQTGGWRLIGGVDTIKVGTAGLAANGLPDIYVITTNGFLTTWSTSGGWGNPSIGFPTTILGLSAGNSGLVYVVTTAHGVYEYGLQNGWLALSSDGFANSVSAAFASSSSENNLLAVTTGNSLYSYASQTGWTLLGNFIDSASAGSTSAGQPEAYVLTTNGDFAKYSVSGGWQVIGAPGTISEYSGTTQDTVYVITTDQSVVGYSDANGWFTLSGPGFAQG